ncbi:DUF4983 domain-containing protein [Pedobacter sp. Du54]|uniref:DUF4983 domain-containing protein n=1 Tax=Pedobacter anseongensis TaxID=3133439 RepID=UPI0030B7B137
MNQLTKKQEKLLINGLALLCLLMVLFFSSCNKDFPNILRTDYPNDTATINLKERKVLYLILDGVRGNALKALNPPTLAQMVKKSIYAYDALSDFQTNTLTNAGAWANATTGVTSDKHKVVSENFSGNDIATYPSLFTRLKQVKPNLRSVSIAASKVFNDNLAIDASSKVNFENDDAKVKDAVIEELKRPDASVLVAQFHSAEIAGAANGYADNTTSYTSAITQLDSYIGNIMSALQQRTNFVKEDWLVVVSSNKGGAIPVNPNDANLGAYSDPSRNNFIIFYNPRFVSQITPKPDVSALPYAGIAPKFNVNNAAVQSDPNFLNLGTNKDATIRFNLRWDNTAGNGNYPAILQKRGVTTGITPGIPGWAFIKDDGGIISLNCSFAGSTGNAQAKGPTSQIITDGKWHSIAVKFYMNGANRVASMFVDGVPAQTPNLTLNGDLNTTSPLTFGKYTNDDCFITEFAVYNIAIPTADIIENSKKTPLTPATDPYYDNLIGYFRGNEGSGNQINDVTGNAAPMNLIGTANWSIFSDVSPNISPLLSSATFGVVINNVDIPYQIYTWMGIPIPSSWQLSGKIWRPTYTDVRNN